MDEHLVEVGREEFTNRRGSGLRIRWHAAGAESVRPRLPWPLSRAAPFEERLDLVRGVGPKTEAELRREGYRLVSDLTRHPRLGREAVRFWSALARRDIPALLDAGARDVELLALFRREDVAVIDIETAGLGQVLPLFLVGCAFPGERGWEVRQYFARGFEEEAAVLEQLIEELAGRPVCASYNGKAFDEPFVRARLSFHGIAPVRFRLHVDLLHACRRAFGKSLSDCRLTTVGASVFGIDRRNDVPGSQVPDLYYQFVRDGDAELMAPILRHNALDLYVLALLTDAANGAGESWEADRGRAG